MRRGDIHLCMSALHLCRQFVTTINSPQCYPDRYLPDGTGLREHPLKLLIVATVKRHPRAQTRRHLEGIDAITLGTIGTEALKLSTGIEKTETVAIGETGRSCHIETVATDLLHPTHELTDCLRGIKRGDIGSSAIHEIGGVAAVERTFQIGRKRVFAMSLRGTAIVIRMLTDKGIQPLTIGGCDILHI